MDRLQSVVFCSCLLVSLLTFVFAEMLVIVAEEEDVMLSRGFVPMVRCLACATSAAVSGRVCLFRSLDLGSAACLNARRRVPSDTHQHASVTLRSLKSMPSRMFCSAAYGVLVCAQVPSSPAARTTMCLLAPSSSFLRPSSLSPQHALAATCTFKHGKGNP